MRIPSFFVLLLLLFPSTLCAESVLFIDEGAPFWFGGEAEIRDYEKAIREKLEAEGITYFKPETHLNRPTASRAVYGKAELTENNVAGLASIFNKDSALYVKIAEKTLFDNRQSSALSLDVTMISVENKKSDAVRYGIVTEGESAEKAREAAAREVAEIASSYLRGRRGSGAELSMRASDVLEIRSPKQAKILSEVKGYLRKNGSASSVEEYEVSDGSLFLRFKDAEGRVMTDLAFVEVLLGRASFTGFKLRKMSSRKSALCYEVLAY